jgi:hypothetical protein
MSKPTKPALSAFGIDWENVDLESPCGRELHIIDPLTFSALLLEVGCNLPEINRGTVRAQFELDLHSRIAEAWSVFEDNLDNLVAYARKERASI